jgi:hypothetical protein
MIVEDMGGIIKLESSEEGKGSVFSFTLPITTPGDAERAVADVNKDATVTIVEPEPAKPKQTKK